jgi:CrcB protein
VRELGLVAIGGAVGSVARVLTTGMAYRLLPAGFAWGTLAVNLIGSFVFGLVLGAGVTRGGLSADARALLLSGLLGGFTTFSAFSFDNFELISQGLVARAALNVGVQVIIGIAALWAGFVLTR